MKANSDKIKSIDIDVTAASPLIPSIKLIAFIEPAKNNIVKKGNNLKEFR